MQTSLDIVASRPAFSPVQKQRYDASGYPSPPSSGRTEHQAGEGSIDGDQSRVDAVEVEARAIEVNISPRQEPHHSLSPPATCEELEDEEEEYNDDSDQDGDVTIVAVTRSRSSTSWDDSLAPSSPSTSVATQSHVEAHFQQTDARAGSPYIEVELPAAPIRDTPRNPFLQGGPADVGYSGPSNKGGKKLQTKSVPRERGKMTYVFRGQRVTYADPYTSDSEDDDDNGPSSSGGSLMDRLQPKLLFPSIGKATVRSSNAARDSFSTVKKSDVVACKPTLEMAVDRQRAGYKSTSHSLLDKINRAGWSDDDDNYPHDDAVEESLDEAEEEDGGEDIPQRYMVDDDDYDEDMVAEDDNPFLQPSCNQASAAFLHRLQQAQVTSSFQSQSGVVRAAHGGHRYNPYNQNQKQSRTHVYARQ